nr:translation initiation factor aIF-2 [Cryptococcus depauperatus CBS 7841]
MAPKNKAKKGGKKTAEDDEFWEKKEAALEAKVDGGDANDELSAVATGQKNHVQSGFDLLDNADLSDEEGGGLMATIAANAAKKDKKKKKKASKFEGLDGEDDNPSSTIVDTQPNPDDEWPEEDVKPKKGKKGKKGKRDQEEEEEDIDAILEKAAADRKAAEKIVKAVEPAKEEYAATNGEMQEEDESPRILTKKEKEKLKKEKEKAKKKAQAVTKNIQESTPAPNNLMETPADEEEGEGDDDPTATGDKKKKKKKKPAAKADAVTPAPTKGKKIPAHIAAMQAAMLEKQRLEEEVRRAEEERRKRIEEEEARILAEETAVAEARALKKQKEKEKLIKAKAEGRLLTPAQKREKAAAEARKQAMLASGMVVAGLQDDTEKKKKPVYGNKKKQQQQTKTKESPAPVTPAPSKSTAPRTEPGLEKEKKEQGNEDDWDMSDNDAAKDVQKGVEQLKMEESEDDWDKSDEEDKGALKTPSVTVPIEVSQIPLKKSTIPTPTAKAASADDASSRSNGDAASLTEGSSEEGTDEDDSSEESDNDDSDDEHEMRIARARQKIQERKQAAQAAQSKDDLRSPICCILGHVDTGKTKLLDKIRQTSVQEGEAGGITQQIGATFFPQAAIKEKTAVVNEEGAYEIKIPGLLIIDTPGHESFSNLRSRGSSLCNIAILVVDITHGLEQQTIESLNLLRHGRTPFIVALNKIDRMYGWEVKPNAGFRQTLKAQNKHVRSEFEDRVRKTKLAFAEQGLNAEIFDENPNLGKNISLVPTSAVTGEGIPDLLMFLVKLTQERMNANLMFISELECTILEVKVIEGLGTTIDVVLSNGVMKEGDKIVLCGSDGPIVTQIRALLTPQPMREMRIKGTYVHHKEVKAALGVKISAPNLEKAIAGARLYVAEDDDEVEVYKEMAMDDLTSLGRFVTKSGKGVWVQASTLGSLEALLTFLEQMKIPVFNFGIGPIHKSTIVKAATMLEKAPEYGVILAFDVQIEKEAEDLAKKAGLRIFSAEIIYHLFDAFKAYMAEVQEAKRKEAAPNAVWPVKLKILKAFAHRDPIILGCDIIEGTMRIGTPMGVVKLDKESGKREIIPLGKITSIEINHKPFDIVKRSQIGAGAAVKIERAPHQPAKLYGRHFDDKDEVVSLISRQSIDTLKSTFRDQVELSDWALIKKMKAEQGVP